MRTFCSVLVLFVFLVPLGCSEMHEPSDNTDVPFVELVYEDGPLADVQVRLHVTGGGEAIAEALSGADGKACFTDLPSPEPAEYLVSLESLSDGGWMLDPKLSNPTTSSLTVQSVAANSGQQIELPRQSVQSLVPLNQR